MKIIWMEILSLQLINLLAGVILSKILMIMMRRRRWTFLLEMEVSFISNLTVHSSLQIVRCVSVYIYTNAHVHVCTLYVRTVQVLSVCFCVFVCVCVCVCVFVDDCVLVCATVHTCIYVRIHSFIHDF